MKGDRIVNFFDLWIVAEEWMTDGGRQTREDGRGMRDYFNGFLAGAPGVGITNRWICQSGLVQPSSQRHRGLFGLFG